MPTLLIRTVETTDGIGLNERTVSVTVFPNLASAQAAASTLMFTLGDPDTKVHNVVKEVCYAEEVNID